MTHILRILLLILCLSSFPAGAEPKAASAPESTTKSTESGKESQREGYQVLAAVLTAAGALAGLVPKLYESVSLMSRRKRDLQRIEDLTNLIRKVHEDSHLSPQTLQRLTEQIEAELESAAESLQRSRERLEEVVEQRSHADLNLVSRMLLLYQPIGLRAGLAQCLAYATVAAGITMAYSSGLPEGVDQFRWDEFKRNSGWVFLVLALILGGIFSMWALSERKRWQLENPTDVTDPLPAWRRHLLLFVPDTVAGGVAPLATYSVLGFWTFILWHPDWPESMRFVSLTVETVLMYVTYCVATVLPLHHWALTLRMRSLQRRCTARKQAPAAPAPGEGVFSGSSALDAAGAGSASIVPT